ncbi:MFS transporter [Algibacillus agarilyticus]|uniref:MFS transporter n=1 Tax=Algibacillus agarilyticus TaxID=2234133 RepID=UPI000DD0799F|nr:MFS transporter [Algibacillus agarilyticus]
MLIKKYLSLSSFYFFYCAILGSILPFFGVYLKANGYSTSLIALTSAILLASNIVAPNFWGWLSDKTGRRGKIIQLGNLLACFSFALLFWTQSYWSIIFVVATFSFCWQGLIAQFEVVTLTSIKGTAISYGRVRMWGSIGFVGAVSLLGLFFEQTSIHYFPHVTLCLFILLWISTLLIQDSTQQQEKQSSGGLLNTLKKPTMVLLLTAILFVNISHGIYYTFFSIYLEALGYSSGTIGALWTTAVVAEILMFIVINKLFKHLSWHFILLISLVMAIVRWASITFFADSLIVLMFSQTLHAFTFSAIHSIMMERIQVEFKPEHQGRGQAIYNSVCVSAGAALGAGIAGLTWDWSHSGTFGISTAFALVALFIAILSGLKMMQTQKI